LQWSLASKSKVNAKEASVGKDIEDKVDELAESLKTERDELRVRMHLMRAEVEGEWEDLLSPKETLECAV
jgi:uncharacterized protein YqgV (UPF0045/DUF77 family)